MERWACTPPELSQTWLSWSKPGFVVHHQALTKATLGPTVQAQAQILGPGLAPRSVSLKWQFLDRDSSEQVVSFLEFVMMARNNIYEPCIVAKFAAVVIPPIDFEMIMLSIQVCIATLSLFTLIHCHSYVVEVRKISNGTFFGAPGYPRAYGIVQTLRNISLLECLLRQVDPSSSLYDDQMTYLLPLDQRVSLTDQDLICKSTQSLGSQSSNYPYLRARPGDEIALRYRENGYISKPILEKPSFGAVSVYGTGKPRESDTIVEIHHIWNANNTGGDQRGRLLWRQSFDDGSCYEKNESGLSAIREASGQPPHDEIDGASLACKVIVRIPDDVPTKTMYTLYWVWDWPSVGNVGGKEAVLKDELYTTCIDIQIV